jgi:uncharacterized protein CbrC (UPF0167 family)
LIITLLYTVSINDIIAPEVVQVTPDYQRRARNKWDAANMTVLACKVRKDAADRVKDAAAKAGQSVSAYVWDAIQAKMDKDSRGD